MKRFQPLIIFLLLSLPTLLSAEGFSLAKNSSSTFKDLVFYIISLINILIPILFAGAFIVFFWGLSKFILNSANEKELANGKNYMLWGIIVLFILLSFRSIISLVVTDFDVPGNAKSIPQLGEGGTSSDSGYNPKIPNGQIINIQ